MFLYIDDDSSMESDLPSTMMILPLKMMILCDSSLENNEFWQRRWDW